MPSADARPDEPGGATGAQNARRQVLRGRMRLLFNREALHKNPVLAHRTHASFHCTVHVYVSSLYSSAEVFHFRLVVSGWKFHVLSF